MRIRSCFCIAILVSFTTPLLSWTPACRAAGRDTPSQTRPTTRPSYDWLTVDTHQQLYDWSCIPMSVEMVLKLLHRVPQNYYALQFSWQNRRDGTFGDFDGRTIAGVTFQRKFFLPRDDKFPLDELFKTIDGELDEGRLVIVSLLWSASFHMFVIVDRTPTGDYRAVSKDGSVTMEVIDVKARIRRIKGTDIVTCTVAPASPATRPASR